MSNSTLPPKSHYVSDRNRPANYADPINIGEVNDDERPDWMGSSAFMLVHVACLAVFFVGFSWAALGLCVITYMARMFGITGVYHRYFSHRTYKTSRWFQFVLAWIGCSAAQQGPLWWAAHHRHHHRFSDEEEDIHSPIQRGFYWAHVGWIICKKYEKTDTKSIPDFAKYPELVFLNNYHIIPPIVLALACFGIGVLAEKFAPGLGMNGWQALVWGFFISTVLCYHFTFSINSFMHLFGKRRFETKDHSRNNWILAIFCMGEGWHNNHHRCPYAEAQGMYWWELDMSHYIIKTFQKLGLVWDVQTHPDSLYHEAEHGRPAKAKKEAAELEGE